MAGPDFGLLQGGTQLNPNAFGTGMQQGAGLVQLQQQAQDRQIAMQEKAAAVEAAKAKAVEDAKRNMYKVQRFEEVRKAPTTDAIERLAIEFPQEAESLLKVHKTKSERQQKEDIALGSRAQAAFRTGQPQIGQQILMEAAAAREAEGDIESANGLRKIAETSKKDLGAATVSTGMFLSAAMARAGMSFKDTFQALETADADKDKARAEADIKRAQADTERDTRLEAIEMSKDQRKMWKNQTGVAWATLKLNREKFEQEADEALFQRTQGKPLTPDAFKHLAEKGAAAVASNGIATEADALADEIEAAGGSGGMDAAATKKYDEIFGSEDPKKNGLYARYETLKSKGIYRDIGPGTKTDDDYAAFERGWPGANANPKFKAAFLRGMAKAARFAAAVENAQADYVSQNGDPSNAKRNIVVGGVPIAAGTTYADAVKRVSQGATITANGFDQ